MPPGVERNCGDWSRNPAHDQHYYSNKAPGVPLLGIPVYALLYWGERFFGADPTSPALTLANCYLLNLFLTVLPLAIAAVCCLALMERLTGDRRWALLLTFGLCFGSLLWPYGTALWGYATAAAFVLIGFWAFAADTPRRLAWAGAWFGLAVLCDYLAIIPLAVLLIALVAARRWQTLRPLLLGGLPPLAVHLAYHAICFGNPILPATFHMRQAYLDAGAVGGVLYFRRFNQAVYGLSISPYRGLLWYMPVLAACLGLTVAGVRR